MKQTIKNSIGAKLRLIPAGEFMMGSNEEVAAEPIHKVKITKPFYIGIYQITQHEWETVMGNNPNHFKGSRKVGIFKRKIFSLENNPVESVSWDDVQIFLSKLNRLEKTNKYRLTTEAEWEYACRAGSTTKYCFGNDEDKLSKYAWFGENHKTGSTHPIGTKAPNKWGLHDMHGNVDEWCKDRHFPGHPSEDVTDPTGPDIGDCRVIRGGCWTTPAEYCTSTFRFLGYSPDLSGFGIGFRIARSI